MKSPNIAAAKEFKERRPPFGKMQGVRSTTRALMASRFAQALDRHWQMPENHILLCNNLKLHVSVNGNLEEWSQADIGEGTYCS